MTKVGIRCEEVAMPRQLPLVFLSALGLAACGNGEAATDAGPNPADAGPIDRGSDAGRSDRGFDAGGQLGGWCSTASVAAAPTATTAVPLMVDWRYPDPAIEVHAIATTSATTAWLVGSAGRVLHYDGARFVVHDPAPEWLTAVWAAADDDVWVTGRNGLLLRFDGSRWRRLDVPGIPYRGDVDFTAVVARTPSEVWVAGGIAGREGSGVVFSFDGSQWTDRTVPGMSHINALSAVDGVVWAFTSALTGDGTNLWRWIRGAWSSELSPPAWDAWADTASSTWVVGGSGAQRRDITGKWFDVPEAGTAQRVAGGGRADVWFGGSGGLIHYDGVSFQTIGGVHIVDAIGAWPGRIAFIAWSEHFGLFPNEPPPPVASRFEAGASSPLSAPRRSEVELLFVTEDRVFATGYDLLVEGAAADWTAALGIGRANGIHAPTRDDLWMVRRDSTRARRRTPSGWQEIESDGRNQLVAIWALPDGTAFATDHDIQPSVLRYDGQRFTRVWEHTGSPLGGGFRGIAGSTASDIYFAGPPGVLHFDGERFVSVSSPGEPHAIWLSPAGVLWAAIRTDLGPSHLFRLEGGCWIPERYEPGFEILGITGTSDQDVWVHGLREVARFDGARWTRRPPGFVVNGMGAHPDHGVWVAGRPGLGRIRE